MKSITNTKTAKCPDYEKEDMIRIYVNYMSKKSIKDMNNIEKLRNSLSAKTVRSTVKSCIVFGVVCQIVALTLFTVSLTKQYLNVATVAANQAKMAAIHETNAVVFSKSIMDVYNSLGEDER